MSPFLDASKKQTLAYSCNNRTPNHGDRYCISSVGDLVWKVVYSNPRMYGH